MTTIFQTMCDRLYDATTTTDFEKAADDMLVRFPKARTWLSWWTQPGHRLMIFKAYRNDELKEEITKFYNMPSTNNVVESNNRSTHRFLSYKEIPVVIAAHDVFRFCRLEINQLHGIRTGTVAVQQRERTRRTVLQSRSDEWTQGRRPPTSTAELFSERRPSAPVRAFGSPSKKAKLGSAHGAPDVTDVDLISMRETIVASMFCTCFTLFIICNTSPDGLQIGTVVQIKNDTDSDRWYMRITDGTVAGDLKVDPYLVGGQWLKANSKTNAEKPIRNNPVYIRTIIESDC